MTSTELEVAIDGLGTRRTTPIVIRKLDQLPGLPAEEIQSLEPVTEQFAFRISPYYSDLIDWSDPEDPLRKIVLPSTDELYSDLDYDASAEADNTKARGLQHKYRCTALLLVNDFCASYCRFCFRKRFTLATDKSQHIVLDPTDDKRETETTFDVSDGIAYIRDHPEIDNVLLTGGDPLMLAPSRLQRILDAVRSVEHINIIRIGTKVPQFDPARIDDAMLDVLASATGPGRRVYLMTHYNHPREITTASLRAVHEAQRRGMSVYNQTPLLAGINDDVDTLVTLFRTLADNGVTPYYLFHCRPTVGNDAFMMSIDRGIDLVQDVRSQLSGLARSFRYSASHDTGKIEIVGTVDDQLVFRYHQAKDPADENRMMLWPRSRTINWLDEVVARSS